MASPYALQPSSAMSVHDYLSSLGVISYLSNPNKPDEVTFVLSVDKARELRNRINPHIPRTCIQEFDHAEVVLSDSDQCYFNSAQILIHFSTVRGREEFLLLPEKPDSIRLRYIYRQGHKDCVIDVFADGTKGWDHVKAAFSGVQQFFGVNRVGTYERAIRALPIPSGSQGSSSGPSLKPSGAGAQSSAYRYPYSS